MGRQFWKPSNMLYPVPPVLVSSADAEGRANIMTAAWTGTVCSDPVMVSVSVRPSRLTHSVISQTKEFVINLPTRELAYAVDYCGVRSGRDIDKFKALKLTGIPSKTVRAPSIGESPVSLECKVTEVLNLGSHDLFVAEVTAVSVDESLVDASGRLSLERAGLLAYVHGEYFALGRRIGKFGWSVRGKKSSRPHRLSHKKKSE